MKLTLAQNRSYKLTLPKKFVQELDWKHGEEIEVQKIKNKIILTKKNSP